MPIPPSPVSLRSAPARPIIANKADGDDDDYVEDDQLPTKSRAPGQGTRRIDPEDDDELRIDNSNQVGEAFLHYYSD